MKHVDARADQPVTRPVSEWRRDMELSERSRGSRWSFRLARERSQAPATAGPSEAEEIRKRINARLDAAAELEGHRATAREDDLDPLSLAAEYRAYLGPPDNQKDLDLPGRGFADLLARIHEPEDPDLPGRGLVYLPERIHEPEDPDLPGRSFADLLARIHEPEDPDLPGRSLADLLAESEVESPSGHMRSLAIEAVAIGHGIDAVTARMNDLLDIVGPPPEPILVKRGPRDSLNDLGTP